MTDQVSGRRVLIIYNPKAGSARRQRFEAVVAELRRLGCALTIRNPAACGDADTEQTSGSSDTANLTVLAASSLTDAFRTPGAEQGGVGPRRPVARRAGDQLELRHVRLDEAVLRHPAERDHVALRERVALSGHRELDSTALSAGTRR